MRAILIADVITAVCRAARVDRACLFNGDDVLIRGHDVNRSTILHAITIIARKRVGASMESIARAIGLRAHASVCFRFDRATREYELGSTALGWALGYLVPRANAILDEEFPWTTKRAHRAATESPATESAAPTARPSGGTGPSRRRIG